MNAETLYIEETPYVGENDVVFITRDSGRKLVRNFDSPYLAMQFANKVKRSKKLVLVSCPIMDY